MPEANVLYSVTAAVVLGLVTWVAVVLKTAKEPWARDLPKPAPLGDAAGPLEAAPPSSSLPRVVAGSATTGADVTAEATAVVIADKDDAGPPPPPSRPPSPGKD